MLQHMQNVVFVPTRLVADVVALQQWQKVLQHNKSSSKVKLC